MSKKPNNKQPTSYLLTSEEMKKVRNILWEARSDIWQTARVSEYNLTGKDPNFPDDAPGTPPNPPKLITRAGLDESYALVDKIFSVLKMLARKSEHKQNTKAACSIAVLAKTHNPDINPWGPEPLGSMEHAAWLVAKIVRKVNKTIRNSEDHSEVRHIFRNDLSNWPEAEAMLRETLEAGGWNVEIKWDPYGATHELILT